MELRIFDNDIGISCLSAVEYEYFNFLYEFDKPIIEIIEQHKSEIITVLTDNIETLAYNFNLTETEKENITNKIETMNKKLNINTNEWLNQFDNILIRVDTIEVLENIYEIIKGINTHIILELSNIENDDYLLENIANIDANLRKINPNIRYIIKQCLSKEETNYEDNSYSAEDVELVLTTIKNLTTVIKQFALSPLEQIMYAYDIVKDRTYIAASKNEAYIESRDLAKILKSDKIVCLGFANLFKALLDNLKIINSITYLSDKQNNEIGHARNTVVINDPKYNINTILTFDPTWDSKKCKTGIIDENRYNFFAREKSFFRRIDKDVLQDSELLLYQLRTDNDYTFLKQNLHKNLTEIQRKIRLIDWKKYFKDIKVDNITFNKIERLINGGIPEFIKLMEDFEFCVFMYEECCKLLNQKLSNENFLRCLYTVRRVENYLNPNKYRLNDDEIIDTYLRYIMPDLSNKEINQYCKLLRLDNIAKKKLNKFQEEDKKDSRDRLLAVLNKINNNMQELSENNYIVIKDIIKVKKI